MIFGYARVSTHEQSLDLQIDALLKAGCKEENIITDKISATYKDRPGLDQLLAKLREGDEIVVWRLDRLGRSLRHLMDLMSDFESQNIGFKSIEENIDTTTATGKLTFHIFGAMAEFERNLIRERTLAGLSAARARGRMGGRPGKLSETQIKQLNKLYKDKEISIAQLCEMFKISKPTLYKYLQK